VLPHVKVDPAAAEESTPEPEPAQEEPSAEG
jgi:hypothetical protein